MSPARTSARSPARSPAGRTRSADGPASVLDEAAWGRAAGAALVVGVGEDLVLGDLFLERALAAAVEAAGPGAAVERIEVAGDVDGLLAALGTPGLFGVRVLVCRDLETVPGARGSDLAAAAGRSDGVLVARAAKLPAALRRALEPIAACFDCTAPTGAARLRVVDALAERAGVRLGGEARRFLGATVEDLPRVRSVLLQCAAASLTAPSLAQLRVLAGSGAGGGGREPWELVRAIERGDRPAALARLDELHQDPFATLGILRSRLGRSGSAWAAIMAAEAALRSSADRDATLDRLVLALCDEHRGAHRGASQPGAR